MLQGPFRIWEGVVRRKEGDAGVLGQVQIRRGRGWHLGQVPAWALVAAPHPVCFHHPIWLVPAALECHRLAGASRGPAPRSPAWVGPPGTTRYQRPPGARGRKPASMPQQPPPACPWLPAPAPPQGPHLHGPLHFLFSFCRVAQGENSAWGVVLWVLFVYLFNLMVCKVMFLFLFYTFQLIFNLCLENDSCNCTFFCLLITMTRTKINDRFCVGGVYGASYFSAVGMGCPAGPQGHQHTPTRWSPTEPWGASTCPPWSTMALYKWPPTRVSGSRTFSFSFSSDFRVVPALSQRLLRGAAELVEGTAQGWVRRQWHRLDAVLYGNYAALFLHSVQASAPLSQALDLTGSQGWARTRTLSLWPPVPTPEPVNCAPGVGLGPQSLGDPHRLCCLSVSANAVRFPVGALLSLLCRI
uniref:uncharacterized protein LOC118149559 n=1 Tax=Callithrix jacchus TaxID=9483 RepID=UPI0023DCEC79|nr:uncharacterized protein LOC118149559 [Callithrix jacchus]